MIPVTQTITENDPASGKIGNCWQAAIASVFDVENIDDVPHFVAMESTEDEPNKWWYQTTRWISQTQGKLTNWVDVTTLSDVPAILRRERGNPDVHPYAILTGQSPRGDWLHAVVVELETGKIVHDPFPTGEGKLLGLVDVTYFYTEKK